MSRAAPLVLALVLAGCATPAAESPGLLCADPCEGTVYEGELRAFEPTLAVDPSDPTRWAVASELWEGDVRWVHVLVTEDAGRTWATTRLPGGGGGTDPLGACTESFDPIVAFHPDGSLLAGGLLGVVSEVAAYLDLVVFRSQDSGRSFPEFSVVTSSDGTACRPQDPAEEVSIAPAPCIVAGNCLPATAARFTDKPYLHVAEDGIVHVSYASGPRFARSDDGGRTWAPVATITEPPGAFSADLAMDADGALYTAFTEWVDAPEYVEGAFVARLDGSNWRVVPVVEQSAAYPTIRAGRAVSEGRLFLGVPLAEDLDGEHTPAILWSDDRGGTWSAPVALDEPVAGGVVNPTLAVDGRGIAYSGFFHHLPDGSNEYRVAALDDGTRVGPLTVSRARIGEQAFGLQLGHYMGLAPLPEGAVAVWVSGEAPETALRYAVVRAQ